MVDYKNQCMGCGGCVIVCPYNAIQLKLNEDGFYQAYVDKKTCVDCGICDSVCPIDSQDMRNSISAYSYQSKDKETLSESASGGFAFDASLQLLKENYMVCSAQYDVEYQRPVHRGIESEQELKKSRNSIYLQSYTVDGFRHIVNQSKGVVIGTPCQISSINNILKKRGKRESFVLIDFFCHGVPSYNLWSKYIGEYQMEKDMENPVVQFRNKKYGWGNFTLRFQDGLKTDYVDYARDKDIFYKVFLENMALNESCYTCPYYGENSSADIRMGDFWGEKYQKDSKGVSAVLVYTEKGNKLLQLLKNKGVVSRENIEEILGEQRKAIMLMPSCRNAVLKALSSKKQLKQINRTILFRYKCIRRLKNILRKG